MSPDDERRPIARSAAHQITTPDATVTASPINGNRVAAWLRLSDDRDRYLDRILDLERRLVVAQNRIDELRRDIPRAFVAGALMIKRQIADEVDDLRQHLVTWDGRREDFGKPRPGDFPGIETSPNEEPTSRRRVA